MAEKQGIQLVFESDTQQAEQSVGALNSQLGALKKEFKDLNSQTKINPKNFEAIKKSLTNLEKQQQAVNEKITIYKNRLIELNKNGQVNSPEWKKLVKEIEKCEETTEWLNNRIEEVKKHDLTPAQIQFNKMGDAMTMAGQKIENAGEKLMGLSAVATGALVGGVASAIQFEDAFSGVEKTVDATDEQLQALKDGIRQMALELPATTTEISAVAESAGQLGIKADDILAFTETMIGLGNSTNLTSEEASTMIAQFSNIVGIDGQYEQLASTLVALGNNGASTERDIMALAQRLAGAGATAGLSAQEIFALSSAMANVGINAEAGGSSMSTFITKIESAVAEGGSQLQQFAQVAGTSASEFAQMWESEPARAIDTFVSGLKKIDEGGGSAILTLQSLGISEIRQRDMLLRLSNAQGEITKNIDLANQSWQNNTALTEETTKKYDNLKSKIEIMKNAINEVAIKIGESLTPLISKCVDWIQNMALAIGNMSPTTIQFITIITSLVAVLGPLLLIIGKVVTCFGQLSLILGAEGAKTGLLATLGQLALPITLITSALLLCWQQSETFRNACYNLWNVICNSLKPIFDALKSAIDKVWGTIQNSAIPIFKRLGDLIGTYLIPIVTLLWEWFERWLLPIIIQLSDFVGTVFSVVLEVLTSIIDALITVVDTLFGWFKTVFEFLEDLGVWDAFTTALDDLCTTVETLVGWFTSLFDWVGQCAQAVGDFFSKWGDKLGEIGSSIGNWVGGVVGGIFGSGGFQSGGYTNNITLQADFNITTQQQITREQTSQWADDMVDIINERLGALV